MITRSRQSTRQAEMPAISQRLANLCATGTRLRSAGWVNPNEHAPGAFSLVRDHVQELSPSCIANRFREHAARQTLHVQIFGGNQPVLVYQRAREFVVKVRPLVANHNVGALQNLYRLTPTVRSFLSTDYLALCDSQFSLGDSIPTRVLNNHPVAECSKGRKANIHANGVCVQGQRLGLNITSEERVPSSSFTLDRERFDSPFYRPREFNFYEADSHNTKPRPLKRVPYLPQRETVKPLDRTEPGITRRPSSSNPPEERFKGLIYPFQRVHQREGGNVGYISPFGFNLHQLISLLKVTNGLAFQSPRVAPFLKRSVVKLATDRQVFIEGYFLPLGGINPVLKRMNHGDILT